MYQPPLNSFTTELYPTNYEEMRYVMLKLNFKIFFSNFSLSCASAGEDSSAGGKIPKRAWELLWGKTFFIKPLGMWGIILYHSKSSPSLTVDKLWLMSVQSFN